MCGVQQLLLHPKFRGSPGGGKGIGNLFPRYPEGESPERPKEINKKRGKRRILHGLNKAAPRSVISWEHSSSCWRWIRWIPKQFDTIWDMNPKF